MLQRSKSGVRASLFPFAFTPFYLRFLYYSDICFRVPQAGEYTRQERGKLLLSEKELQ